MKEVILQKATELFLNLGFKSVTMDDLANEMGISKKTIYTHFDNKTKLVEECTTNLCSSIARGIEDIIAQQKNPIEELYEIRRFVMTHFKTQKSSPQYQLQKYYPKLYKTLKKRQFAAMQECVMANVKRGMAMGMYRDNLNVEFVSRMYFCGVTGLKDPTLFPPARFSLPQLMKDYLEYHLRGIVTSKGRKIVNIIIHSNQE